MGKGEPGVGEPAGHEEVHPIEGGTADPDQHLVGGADGRRRDPLDRELVQSSGAGEGEG
jgi:hypothetical protein